MELNNTSSLFEVFTGFNLLYSLTRKETFADVLNDRIIKPYDNSEEYINTIQEEIYFYFDNASQLQEKIEYSETEPTMKAKLLKDVKSLISMISLLEEEISRTIQHTRKKIEISKNNFSSILNDDFSYISLFFAFFSIHMLYIIPSNNNHRILSILFLDIIAIITLLSVFFRKKIEKIEFKIKLFNIVILKFNPLINIFLFRSSTWRNFSHINIILLYTRIAILCLFFHALTVDNIPFFNYNGDSILLNTKDFFHRYQYFINIGIIFFTTMLPISHFIIITFIAIARNIIQQFTLWFQVYFTGKFSLRLIKERYKTVSDEYNLLIDNTLSL